MSGGEYMIGDPFQILLVLGVVVVLLLWGPKKIPELARAIGEAKRALSGDEKRDE